MSLLKIEEGFASGASEWPHGPIGVYSGKYCALAEDGYLGYGTIGGDWTVERTSHFESWEDLKTEDDVALLLCNLVASF